MTCACGMDSVGTCLVCGSWLCQQHAFLRGSELGALEGLVGNQFWRVRADLRPLFRFRRSGEPTLRR